MYTRVHRYCVRGTRYIVPRTYVLVHVHMYYVLCTLGSNYSLMYLVRGTMYLYEVLCTSVLITLNREHMYARTCVYVVQVPRTSTYRRY
mgnify:CR=1 FL=1